MLPCVSRAATAHSGPLNPELKIFLARRAPELERLAALEHPDPGQLLGLHREVTGNVLLTWLPAAARAWVQGRPMVRLGGGPLFGWAGRAAVPEPYRICWHDARGRRHDQYDPYSFPLVTPPEALARHAGGGAGDAHRSFGACVTTSEGVPGVRFVVWAPRARSMTLLVSDRQRLPMRPLPRGSWELFVPGLRAGCRYRYEVLAASGRSVKTDPYARQFEPRPGWNAVVAKPDRYRWTDAGWLALRRARGSEQPISIYELHLGSYARCDGTPLGFAELAERVVAHVAPLGFTHVELLPIMEHPHEASWGYQTTGYFAPSSRHGDPAGFCSFVDALHRANLGVILDWVPGHFATDPQALVRFDGEPLYEPEDPRRAEISGWGALAFNFARPEVRSFLLSSARYWLEEFHVDGLRVDAVASMLYLDYGRPPGEWLADAEGGNENRAAIAWLRSLTSLVRRDFPGVDLYAEDASIRPGTTATVAAGGLGFDYKWSLGWMHDSLGYFGVDPLFRRHHHQALVQTVDYAWPERQLLALSHDEVVHGKHSLLGRMPGDAWQRHANLRLLYAWQWTHPGAKLLFMGGEYAQASEWDHRRPLPRPGADDAAATGVCRLVADLNRLYRSEPALHAADASCDGFQWLERDESLRSIYAYARHAGSEIAVVVLNCTPVPRLGFRVGLPHGGGWQERLNTDAAVYGGSNLGNLGRVVAERDPAMGQAFSVKMTLPPLAAVILTPDRSSLANGTDDQARQTVSVRPLILK